MSEHMNKDDALFEQLSRQKKQRRRKILTTVLVIVLLAALAVTIAVFVLRRRVREKFAGSMDEVLSWQVQTGTLSTVVSGSGVLAEDALEEITVPEGVELLEVKVDSFDTVTQGQVLATVEMSTVLSAMADLQTELEELDEAIHDAESDKVSASVTSGVAGRVKAVYGEKGMKVEDCMTKHGCLALLSLDGFMAVDVETEALSAGDRVSVTLEDGTTLEGSVERTVAGVATVLFTDDGPQLGERVTVMRDGQTLGQGQAFIHESLSVTGYAGTIQNVNTAAGRKVNKGTVLFTLTDTGTDAEFNTLLRSRQELEDTLLELLTLRRSGAVLAPFSGSVYTVDYDETLSPLAVVTLSRDEKMTVTLSVDESDILSLEVGQTVELTLSSLGDAVYTGTLTEVDRTSTGSGTYTAEVTMPKAEGMLPGMTAKASIQIRGVENAMLIPVEALQQTRDRYFVYTSYDAETEAFGGEVDVSVGIIGADQVEILSGLEPGDTVWYEEEFNFMDMFSGMGAMGGSGSRGGSGGSMPAMPSGSGGFPGGGMPQGFDPRG